MNAGARVKVKVGLRGRKIKRRREHWARALKGAKSIDPQHQPYIEV